MFIYDLESLVWKRVSTFFEDCLIIFGQNLLIPVIVKLQQIFGILPIEEMKLESGKKVEWQNQK